ncbi:carboxymuconolactone decarboxylase family protein [Pedobacter petrophilus]
MSAQTNSNQGLNSHQTSMISIAAYTSVGDVPSLKTELNTGLDAGLKVEEIKEAMVQLYAYCGFPRSLSAINTLMTVLEERKAKGITDQLAKSVAVENHTTNRYEQGRKVLEELTKTPQKKPAPGFGEFAPRIDAFLKEHLFADVFSNEVLNYRQRELVTISALASMAGVEAQLQSHITMGKNTGITAIQLKQLAAIIESKINRTQANTVRKIIGEPILPVMEKDMMVRISEIEILPEYLAEYNAILKEESSASVKIEPGVLAIFPMFQKESPNQIRIIEIYANKAAYQSHLTTPHFKQYKTATLKMVKDLKLIDMNSLDEASMTEIFKKLK